MLDLVTNTSPDLHHHCTCVCHTPTTATMKFLITVVLVALLGVSFAAAGFGGYHGDVASYDENRDGVHDAFDQNRDGKFDGYYGGYYGYPGYYGYGGFPFPHNRFAFIGH